jgi:hypothetical protein
MASKPGNSPGSEVRRGVMKTVITSSQSRHHKTHSTSGEEILPLDLQKLVNREEQDRMVYEDAWTRTCGPLLHDVPRQSADVSCRRPSDKFDEQHHDHRVNEPSERLPLELQKLVDKEEADRLLYEDSWTRTLVHSCSSSGLLI